MYNISSNSINVWVCMNEEKKEENNVKGDMEININDKLKDID